MLEIPLVANQTRVPRTHDYGASREFGGLMEALCRLTDEEVMRILIFVVAEILPAQSVTVEALGAGIEVDMTSISAPDQTFFDLLRDKPAPNATVMELAGEEVAAVDITSTAKVHKSIIKASLDGTRET